MNWPEVLLSKPQEYMNTRGNLKFSKRRPFELNWEISGLSLAPEKSSGVTNVCPFSTTECVKYCINQTGYGKFNKVQEVRKNKVLAFHTNKDRFIKQLIQEIIYMKKSVVRRKHKLAIRLNVFSDIEWEKYGDIFLKNQDVQFYDYTKNPSRMLDPLLPPNYDLTFSGTGEDTIMALNMVQLFKKRVALVLENLDGSDNLPIWWQKYFVLDGDESDLRFNDEKCLSKNWSFVVGLSPKGKLKNQSSPFKIIC